MLIDNLNKKDLGKSFRKRITLIPLMIFLMMPLYFFGQTVPGITWSANPIDLALYARSGNGGANNKGTGDVVFAGDIDKTVTPIEWDKLEIIVTKRNSNGSIVSSNTEVVNLSYSGNIASFTKTINIDADFVSYDFQVDGIRNSPLNRTVGILVVDPANPNDIVVSDVVAGDVYVIQGQSNAVADQRGGSAQDFEDFFIRTYGSASDEGNIPGIHDQWYEGIADMNAPVSWGSNRPGHVGQWGIKLANLIMNSEEVPVAMINGADDAREIDYFKDDSSQRITNGTNNYERLYHRLEVTNLRQSIKAIFWSQGEANIAFPLYTSTFSYISSFNELKGSWEGDYGADIPIYIFQSKSGCSSNPISLPNYGVEIKEAQRRLAADPNNNIHLMQTAGLVHASGYNNCHFDFTGGYEEFAKRIFKLLDRDIYGATQYDNIDIDPPMPTVAYLSAPNTVTVETTTKNGLEIPNSPTDENDFAFSNGASITAIVTNGNNFEITFSGSLSSSTTLQYVGMGAGQNETNLIVNNQGLELVCFDKFPIELVTVWDGSKWNPTLPIATMEAEIDGNYDASDGSLESLDLTINNGAVVDFDSGNGGINNIIVNGDLTNNGSLTIGDMESLIAYGDVLGNGTFNKIEKTTTLKSRYDVTYFSSSVESASLSSTFPGVVSNRIFHYDPINENIEFTGVYQKYRHWFVASGNMIPGKGYSVDGRTDPPSGDSYPNYKMEVTFTGGRPNHGDIAVPISKFSSEVEDYDRANLLGNPYPSAIDPIALIDENINSTGFRGTLYLWTHGQDYNGGEYSADDYVTFNKGGVVPSSTINEPYSIASGQGFMILTDNLSENFIFKPSMQVASKNTDFYKAGKIKNPPAEDAGRIWLKLRGGDQQEREVLVAFLDEASDKIDPGYDGRLFTIDGPLTFYTLLKKEKYVIQGLNSFARNRNIKLGFSNAVMGDYSIEISKIKGFQQRPGTYLIDKELHLTHDLSQGAYHFTQLEAGDFANRFSLRFKNNNYDFKQSDNGFFDIHYVNDGFEVVSDQKIRDLKVYDIFGRLIFQDKPNKYDLEFFIPKVKKGSIILVNGTLDNGSRFNKKVIKL